MYKKGKDLKIKGIENLEGLPDYIIYKTDIIESLESGSVDYDPEFDVRTVGFNEKKPEGFEGW